MILKEEILNCSNFVKAYNGIFLDINGRLYQESVVVQPEGEIEFWGRKKFDEIKLEDFNRFSERPVDLIIFGTGTKHHFLPSHIYQSLYKKGLHVETMTSRACCGIFRILAEEKRRFLAIITIEQSRT